MNRVARFLLPAVVLAFYGRVLGRGFTSEDFLLIRFLGENPPWRDLVSHFTAPWLGIYVVQFWRPVSTFLYSLEIAAFGARPAGYNVLHVLVHTVNALLVGAIAHRLGRRSRQPDGAAPLTAALLFALFPLAPNAVIFGASFATLFAATFLFGAFLAWLRFQETGRRAAQLLALGLFALALGSYEAAVVFPAALVASAHLLPTEGDGRRHLARVTGYAPFLVLTGLYLLLRKSLFGVFLGGYEEQGRRLLTLELGPLVRDLATSIVQLHVPLFGWTPGPAALGIGCALLLGVPLAALWGGSTVRVWLLGWIWVLAALAPFAFRPVVPANGRYWYLAAAGVAWSLAALLRRRVRSPLPALLVLVVLVWGFLLHGYLDVYQEAGRTAEAVQQELLRTAEPGATGPRFLVGPPDFLRNPHGVPVAQVLRYGVWDTVHPPFASAAIEVHPLPPLQGAELLPVRRGAPGSRIDVWDAEHRTLRPADQPADAAAPPELAVLAPAAGAALDPARDLLEVAVPPGAHARYRLIVSTRGNPAVVELGPEAVQGGILRASLPASFCRSMDRLYGGEMYWWIEARDAAGGVSGLTRMQSFRVASVPEVFHRK
ncbi:MAG TPA: hypothetical protein DD490_02170 [Acidobacteria bacterium]|nr:hypothetical protein [Acidobacteriota bacterium]